MSAGVSARGKAKIRREMENLEEDAEEGGEINLVPYLDIVVNILLFLLVSVTSMVALGNIEVVLPQKSNTASMDQKPQEDKPDLNLTVVITDKGFTLASSGSVMFQNDVPGQLPTIPKAKGGSYNYPELQKLLLKLKSTNLEEKKAILTADPSIVYEHVIGVMDALRVGPDGKPLFPLVRFSTGIATQ